MLAVIPARGGSKGLPGKNIKMLNGKPLIAYSIESALESKFIDRVIVSTDDEEIAEVALKFDAEVPFLRPKELSEDNSKSIDNFIYTIDKLNESEKRIDSFIVLQPTSPLRKSKHIDEAISLFHKKNALSVVSVVESQIPLNWHKKILDSGVLVDYFKNCVNNQNRQEGEKLFLPNGAIYIFDFLTLKNNYNYYNEKTYPYIMNEIDSLDIDTLMDFKLAELLIKNC